MIVVDARGMRCPWPVVRLARAMREGGAGTVVRLLADDPRALRDTQALAAERGWVVVARDAGGWQEMDVRCGQPQPEAGQGA